jgi:hypothetical protein
VFSLGLIKDFEGLKPRNHPPRPGATLVNLLDKGFGLAFFEVILVKDSRPV